MEHIQIFRGRASDWTIDSGRILKTQNYNFLKMPKPRFFRIYGCEME